MPENTTEAATDVVARNSFGTPRRELLFKVTVAKDPKTVSSAQACP